MSHKKSKTGHNQTGSNPSKERSNECHYHRQDHVSVSLEMESLQSLVNECKAERDKKTSAAKLQVVLQSLTLLFVIIYTVLTGYYVRTANKTYAAAYRPYVGVQNIVHVNENPETHQVMVRVEFKNSGIVEATNLEAHWKVLINGQNVVTELPGAPETAKHILIPGESGYLKVRTEHALWERVVNHSDTLEIEIRLKYSGPDETYTQCERAHYFPDTDTFLNFGVCAYSQ